MMDEKSASDLRSYIDRKFQEKEDDQKKFNRWLASIGVTLLIFSLGQLTAGIWWASSINQQVQQNSQRAAGVLTTSDKELLLQAIKSEQSLSELRDESLSRRIDHLENPYSPSERK